MAQFVRTLGWSPADSDEGSKTHAPAQRLPSETIHAIVSYLCRGEDKSAVIGCVLTCKHWALRLRPVLLRHLFLRSQADIDTFIALAEVGLPTEQPITMCVRVLDIALILGTKPWLHLVGKLERFTRSVTKRLVCYPRSSLRVYHSENLARETFSTLPKCLPQSCLSYTSISLTGAIVLAGTLDMIRFIDKLRWVQYCQLYGVTFNTMDATPSPRSARRRSRPRLEFQCSRGSQPHESFANRSDIEASISLLTCARSSKEDSGLWIRLMGLIKCLAHNHRYESASTVYLPGDDVSTAQLLELTLSEPQSISLMATFSLFESLPQTMAFVTSLALTLPSETTERDVDWNIWKKEISELGLDSVPITIHPPTTAYNTPAPDSDETESGPWVQNEYTLLVRLRQVDGPRPYSYHNFTDYSEPIQHILPGVIIPQRKQETPLGKGAFKRLQSIVIRHQNGGYGINLQGLLSGSALFGIHGAQSIPFLSDTGMRLTLRILWPGYPDWRYENGIDVFDHTYNAKPQTLERIAVNVARLVKVFYDEMRARLNDSSTEQDWQLDRIDFYDLYLLELHHVSRGSWQPVICWSVPCD